AGNDQGDTPAMSRPELHARLQTAYSISSDDTGRLMVSAGLLGPRFDPSWEHNEEFVTLLADAITWIGEPGYPKTNGAQIILNCSNPRDWALEMDEHADQGVRSLFLSPSPPTIDDIEGRGRTIDTEDFGTYINGQQALA